MTSEKPELPNDAAHKITQRIADLPDWHGKTLAHIRKLIHAADPAVQETWKWRGVPVWEHAGILCTGETYKAVVKLTFARGAALPDPVGLFNSSLDGNVRRAIDLREGETLDEAAFADLLKAAVAANLAAKVGKSKPGSGTGSGSGPSLSANDRRL